MKKDRFQNLLLWVVRKKTPAPFSSHLTKEVKMNWKALPALVVILSACLASTAYAISHPLTPLTGSGIHLLNSPLGAPPRDRRLINPDNSPVDFTGVWPGIGPGPGTALWDWVGTFYATGPLPGGTTAPGTTIYDDFTGLNAGFLPAYTMFQFGDVDYGSQTTETFTLNAWDPNGTLITSAWLSEPTAVWGTSGTGGTPDVNDMPGWTFTAGEYFIDGRTESGPSNPNVSFILETIYDIGELRVIEGGTQGANLYLAAPVPEPATIALLGLGGLLLRRREGKVRKF